MKIGYHKHNASFRDPDGFVFSDENKIVYRQLNQSYKEHYLFLKNCGLYEHLVNKKMLIPHQEIEGVIFDEKKYYKTILPEQITFISYPYEWCFDQFKDASLLTLELIKESLKFGMILKDATPFNIQFQNGKCIFIDTLSFEKYVDGNPWVSYRQFCECFLSPLLLSYYSGNNLNKFLTTFPDGIPLNLVSKLLPFKSRFNTSVLLHIHFQAGYKNQNSVGKKYSLSKNRLFALINSLENLIKNLNSKIATFGWSNYYSETILSNGYIEKKKQIIENILNNIEIKTVLDLGANTGTFSKIIANRNIKVIASDFDESCINATYKKCKDENISSIFPLVIDIVNPTPAIGWGNNERSSFLNRANFDLTLALALVHHLAIGKNIPLEKIAETFSSISNYLIIEFIPKNDEKVKLLLQNRKDIFDNYSLEVFEDTFFKYYNLISKELIENTERIIYFFKKK